MYPVDAFVKPSLDQTRWVLDKVWEHAQKGGTYRKLIYGRMGYGPEAYCALYPVGMNISNAFCDLETLAAAQETLLQFIRDARDCLASGDPETAKSLLVNAIDYQEKHHSDFKVW